MTDAHGDTLTEAAMHELLDRFLAGITAADLDAVRACYAPDATIWHNFDDKDQTVDENLVTLVAIQARAEGMAYTEIRRFLAPGGCVQQHVLRGRGPGGELAVHAIVRLYVDGGRITRLEEYLDPAQAMVLFRS